MQNLHTSVMLQEAVEALKIKSDGIYIDATFGGGGHSKLILEQLGENGKLFSYDKDSFAENIALNKDFADSRFVFKKTSFSEFGSDMIELGLEGKISGILFDLGVSSPQLDDADRGFSFMQDGPLDMRMDTSKGFSAADFLNKSSEQEISDVLYKYGDEKASRKIAKAIIDFRSHRLLKSKGDLVKIVESILQRTGRTHPATKTFQGIRIHVNNELEHLELALGQLSDLLSENGIIVIISFHSLEDRIVKNFFKPNVQFLPKDIPINNVVTEKFHCIKKKVKPSAEEIKRNPRSRSAVMRVFSKA